MNAETREEMEVVKTKLRTTTKERDALNKQVASLQYQVRRGTIPSSHFFAMTARNRPP